MIAQKATTVDGITMLRFLLVMLPLFVGSLTSEQRAKSVDLRDGSALTIVRAATLRQKLQIKLVI